MTNHETFRELIALQTYGETDAAESARLDEHLATCTACNAFAREMRHGLGALATSSGSPAEMPPGWATRLSEATEREPRRLARIAPWWTAVAGFAAGVVAAAMIGRGSPAASPVSPERGESTWERFHRETPPPLATTRGQLAQLGGYLRR